MKDRTSCWASLLLASGTLFALLSATILLFWLSLYEYVFTKELTLVPGTERYKYWLETPLPIRVDVYLFNWTNPEHVESRHKKPIFQEIGPYTFFEKRTKVGVVWNQDKTVTYRQAKHWWFDPQASKGKLTDRINTVNTVPLVAAKKMSNPLVRMGMSFGLSLMREEVHTNRTAEELLFGGYSDTILTMANALPNSEEVPEKFGWFYNLNGSDVNDGTFTVETGEGDLSRVGLLSRWRNSKGSVMFEARDGEAGGTTGEIFPARLPPTDTLAIFSPDLCRTLHMSLEGEEDVNGVPGLRYVGQELREEACSGAGCPPRGLFDISSCKKGAPIFLSYPHFHMADPQLRDMVLGLNPDPAKHGFHMVVQPTLGSPIKVRAGFQVNLKLEGNEDVKLYRHIPRSLYLPVMWLDMSVELEGPLRDKVMVFLWAPQLGVALGLALFALSLALFAAGLRVTLGQKKKQKKRTVPNVPLTRRQTEEPLLGV